jgi:DNA gyrase/topoisomerase IV subunit B
MIEAVSIMNTGGKYDSKAFKKSVGLNGVGTKAVNALSSKVLSCKVIAMDKRAKLSLKPVNLYRIAIF